jgi:hypothetical protein
MSLVSIGAFSEPCTRQLVSAEKQGNQSGRATCRRSSYALQSIQNHWLTNAFCEPLLEFFTKDDPTHVRCFAQRRSFV